MNTKICIALDEVTIPMAKYLQQECAVNLSAFVRRMIRLQYEKEMIDEMSLGDQD